MRNTAQQIAAIPQPSGPPNQAAADGAGTGLPAVPAPVLSQVPGQIASALGKGSASDIQDGDIRFTGKVSFDQDQPRICRITYVGTTILKPGEVGVITEERVKDGIPHFKVTNTSSTFSLEYIVNGEKLLKPGDDCDLSSLDSPVYAAYNDANTPANGETWGPTATDGRLNKNYPGFRIEGNAANGRVRVVREEFPCLLAKADASDLFSATITCSVYVGAGGAEADTTWNVSAYNRTAIAIISGWVLLVRVAGHWEIWSTINADGGTATMFLGKNDAYLAEGASGTISLWLGTPGSETDTLANFTAYNRHGALHAGTWVMCTYNGSGWYITGPAPACLLGKTDAAVAENASVTVSVWGGTPFTEADTTANVTAYNRLPGIPSGAWVLLIRCHGLWYIVNTIASGGGVQSGLLGKADASHASGASGTISVWTGTAGSETDSTVNVTAYNRSNTAIASGDWVFLEHNGYAWYVIPMTVTTGSAPTAAYGGLAHVAPNTEVAGDGTYKKVPFKTSQITAVNATADTTDDDITVDIAGDYFVCFNASAIYGTSPGASSLFQLHVNGTNQSNYTAQADLNATQLLSVGLNGLITLAASDVVDVRCLIPNSKSLFYYSCTFSVHLIKAA